MVNRRTIREWERSASAHLFDSRTSAKLTGKRTDRPAGWKWNSFFPFYTTTNTRARVGTTYRGGSCMDSSSSSSGAKCNFHPFPSISCNCKSSSTAALVLYTNTIVYSDRIMSWEIDNRDEFNDCFKMVIRQVLVALWIERREEDRSSWWAEENWRR